MQGPFTETPCLWALLMQKEVAKEPIGIVCMHPEVFVESLVRAQLPGPVLAPWDGNQDSVMPVQKYMKTITLQSAWEYCQEG